VLRFRIIYPFDYLQTVGLFATSGLYFGIAEIPISVDLRLVDVTATSARLFWKPLSCEQYLGSFYGYELQLRELGEDDKEQKRVIASEVITNTETYFSNLIPLTNYSFSLYFRNLKVSVPSATTIEFITLAEDGMFLCIVISL